MSEQEGWSTVPVAEDESTADVARDLLALTDNPRDVVWVPGTNEFLVTDAVGEAYRKAGADEAPKQSSTPKPTRRTRAKKETSDG